jgi:hypothetical protein
MQIGCNVFHHLTPPPPQDDYKLVHTVTQIRYTFLIINDDIYICVYVYCSMQGGTADPHKVRDFAPTGNCFRIAGSSKIAMSKPD